MHSKISFDTNWKTNLKNVVNYNTMKSYGTIEPAHIHKIGANLKLRYTI